MIAVDWGTTNFRAFRINAHGDIVARHSSAQGILSVSQGRFAEALSAEVGAWLAEGENHILLCGMIGSRQGWVEAPYLACPVGIAALADAVVPIPFAAAVVRLVPGVMGSDTAAVPELMRGEETAAIGMLDTCAGSGLVCFPGTHNKWVHLSDHKIVSFTTCMTGEVYGALQKCTILERSMTPGSPFDPPAFHQGVARSADPGGLLHHLFGVRTLVITGQLREDVSASYLSGLLIGHDVRAIMPPGSCVHLVGEEHLCNLYAQAIQACGGSAIMAAEDAAAHGLAAIARRLQWT